MKRLCPILFALILPLLLTACSENPLVTTIGAVKPAQAAAAVGTLKSLAGAETLYLTKSGGQFGSLSELHKAGLVDSRFSMGEADIDGYHYSGTSTGSTYKFTARPENSALPSYQVTESGTVCYTNGTPAG